MPRTVPPRDPRTGLFKKRGALYANNRPKRRRNGPLFAGAPGYRTSGYRNNRPKRRNMPGVPVSGAAYRPRFRVAGLSKRRREKLRGFVKSFKKYTAAKIGHKLNPRRRARPKRDARGRYLARDGGRRRSTALARRRPRRGVGRQAQLWTVAAWRTNPQRGRRHNPGLVAMAKENTKSLFRLDTWVGVGTGALGISAAIGLPVAIAKGTKKAWLNEGWYGVGLSAVTAAGVGALGSAVSPRVGKGLLYGGLLTTLIKAIGALAPRQADKYLPRIPATRGAVTSSAPATDHVAATAADLVARGVPPSQAANAAMIAASGGAPGRPMQGLGILSPEDLIQGETAALAARQADALGDWVELQGLGGGAENRLPYGSVKGMGDWMEFAAEPPAAAGAFEPVRERF